MAVQVSTQGSLAPEFKTFYDRTLLERALPELVHLQFGQQRPIGPGQGKTIEFRRFSSLPVSTTPLTEGVTPAGNSLTVTAITASVNQYGDYLEGSDLLDLTAIDPILTETASLLGEQAGYSLDTIAKNALVGGTSVQYANGRTARTGLVAGDNLTVTEIRKAVRTLQKNKARPVDGGAYVALVSPSAVYDIQSDAAWRSASEYAGSQQIFSGEVGQLYGVRFVQTTETAVFAGAGGGTPPIDVHATLVLGANAYGIIPLTGQNLDFIFKPLGSAGTADALDQRWTSGWKAAFTVKILQDAFMVRIEHAVSG
ncbi:MAG: N4-gp56 family major capsid protein [Actinomycetota bacterium]|nr:N4-gp56 family major capsid protein [Actinomycetota bacterium]